MAIIYSYPQTKPIQGNELFVVSSRTTGQPTMTLELTQIINYIPSVLDLDAFSLYGVNFSVPPPTPLANNYTLVYSGTTGTWQPGPIPNPIVPTEIYEVVAVYDVASNNYIGATTGGIPGYETNVIYKTTFDVSNPVPSSTLSIDSFANEPLVVVDNTGVPQPIPSSTIVSSQVYYISHYAGNFQLSTEVPPVVNNPVIYWNPNPVSIAVDVGGVPVSTQSNPITWEKTNPITGLLEGYTFQECMDRIFYPYQMPAFQTFSMNNYAAPGTQSTALEVGDSLQGGVRQFTWTFNQYESNAEPNTLGINDTSSSGVNPGATNPLTSNMPLTPTTGADIGNSIALTTAGNRKWQAFADTTADNPNGVQLISSPSFTVNWYYKWFWGTSSNTELTQVEILTLLNDGGISSGNPSGTFNFDATGSGAYGEYWYLAFPDVWGDLNSWKLGSNDVDTNAGGNYSISQGGSNDFRFYGIKGSVPVNPGSPSSPPPINYRVYRTAVKQNGIVASTISI